MLGVWLWCELSGRSERRKGDECLIVFGNGCGDVLVHRRRRKDVIDLPQRALIAQLIRGRDGEKQCLIL